jgi:hypothetical protein
MSPDTTQTVAAVDLRRTLIAVVLILGILGIHTFMSGLVLLYPEIFPSLRNVFPCAALAFLPVILESGYFLNL